MAKDKNILDEIEFAREMARRDLAIGAAMAAAGWIRRAERLERELSDK